MLHSADNAHLLSLFDFVVLLAFVVALLLLVKDWREQKSVLIAAIIVTLYILITADTFSIFFNMDTYDGRDFYLRWIEFGSLSIIAIIISHLLFRIEHSRVTSVVMYMLIINVFLHFSMHIDIIEKGNRAPWWLWDLYTPTINILNLSIATLMIINSIINMKNKQAINRRFAENVAIK